MDIKLLFVDDSYRDVLSLLKLFLGKRARRELGKTSKTIYDNLGGVECAKNDYSKLYRREISPLLYAKMKGLEDPVELYYEEPDFVNFVVKILNDKIKREKLLYQDLMIIKASFGAWKEYSTQEMKDFLVMKIKYYKERYS